MATRPVNLRFPIDLYNALQDYSKANGRTISDTIFGACERLLETSTPGLCTSCHHQNEPTARYCSECSSPLTGETIESLQSQIDDLNRTMADQIAAAVDDKFRQLDDIETLVEKYLAAKK